MVVRGLDTETRRGPQFVHAYFNPKQRTDGPYACQRESMVERRQQAVPSSVRRGLGEAALYLYEPMDINKDEIQPTLQGEDLLAYEIAQLALIDNQKDAEFAADFSGVSPERFRELAELAETEADTTAGYIGEFIDMIVDDAEVRDTVSERIGYDIDPDTPKIIVAGLLLANAAHEGQYRQNIHPTRGNYDYMNHVLDTAILYQLGVEDSLNDPNYAHLYPEDADTYRQLFRTLMHDAVEDSIPRKERAGRSYLEGERLRVTPLLVEKLLIRLEEDPRIAADIVDDNMHMAKPRGLEDETISDDEYAKRFTSTIGTSLTKSPDTGHNLHIDPMKVAIDENGRPYDSKNTIVYTRNLKTIGRVLDDIMNDEWGVACWAKMQKVCADPKQFHERAKHTKLGILQRPKQSTETLAA